MADSEIVNDRTPLLERKGSISSIDSCNKLAFRTLENDDMKIKAVIDTENSKYGISNVIDVTEDSDCMLPYEENGSNNPESYDIVCIFTVAFDTRAGNIVEWYLPSDCNVDGIEFRAMASGSHRVQTDFIYFKRGQLYGLACFENMPVDNVSERGARMKSVGVLAVTYTSLHYHMNFLRKQVRQLLENPGSYTEMEAYYERHKGSFPTFNAFSDHSNIDTTKLWNNIMPLMKITHPAGCFSQFLNFFGERIFVLWKLALLKKRIIFFSPPPIGVVCYRVYCTISLTAHHLSEIGYWCAEPFFYVNIADMDNLGSEKVYVACTTEKIFQSKTNLYDLYVDNQNFTSEIPMIQKLMSTSYADKKKYDELCSLQSQMNFCQNGDIKNEEGDETWFMRYFMNLNDKLFRKLLDVSRSESKQWTIEHMHSIGLDPVNDRTFIMELVDTYGIDIVATADTLCCSP
ncbi:DENN domain-containing protein 11 [Trichonephila inaurata madagascariensis]|uniref:DENN domain-containing protein 11 n=1 Tax=Trichonephila inaurata madagascariensis TaxID=2747483 RepID=A0A8X6XDC0_9ARAC|nr:DENN domain-containing protein 11 [Trichonephila inaurata madagascariensis]